MAITGFYPTEIVHKIINGRPSIFIFGRKADDRQICVFDDSFLPYFYVKAGSEVIDLISSVRQEELHVISTSLDKKYFNQNQIEVIKVIVNLPRALYVLSGIIKKIQGVEDIFGHDISYEKRYIMDKQIIPFTLTHIEGEFVNFESRVSVFKLSKIIDIDTDYYKKPKSLALKVSIKEQGNEATINKIELFNDKTNLQLEGDETQILIQFKEILEAQKPDFLIGWESDSIDLPFIYTRAKKFNIKMDLGLDYSDIRISKSWDLNSSINGITHIDIAKTFLRIYQKDFFEINNAYCEIIENKEILNECEMIYLLSDKILPTIIELSRMVGLFPFDISRMGRKLILDWYYISQLKNQNNLIPNNNEKPYSLPAMQFESQSGIFDNISLIDLFLIYPDIISTKNIDPHSINCICCKGIAPVVFTKGLNEETWFCQKVKGPIAKIAESLYGRYMRIKEIQSDALHSRKDALKLLLESIRSYFLYENGRWFSPKCQEALQFYAKEYIQQIIIVLQSSGFNVLISNYYNIYASGTRDVNQSISTLPNKINVEISEKYKKGIFLVIDNEENYRKAHALIRNDNFITWSGIKFGQAHSHYSELVIEKVIEKLLLENNYSEANDFYNKALESIRTKSLRVKDFELVSRLSKDPEEYEIVTLHVATALRMRNRGIYVRSGMLIRYVVESGNEKLRDRVRMPNEVILENVDSEYYIENYLGIIGEIFNFYEEIKTEQKGLDEF